MEFISKYEIGDEVFFYNARKCKVEHGIITTISLYVHQDETIDWTYGIRSKMESKFAISDMVKPAFIFRDRDEVFKFAYQITENI